MSLIMIVEDEQIVALDIRNKLRTFGYLDTVLATSGEQAILVASERHPALVIMDIVLDGAMDGIEAASRIQRLHNTPVIFLTSHGGDKTVERAIEILPGNFVRIIVKPFEELTLRSAVALALVDKH